MSSASSSSFYDVLGVSEQANPAEIKKAYRSLSLRFHPDRNQEPDSSLKFQKINEAYETLSDPQKKREYDMTRRFENIAGDDFPLQDLFEQMFSGGGLGMGMGNIHVFRGGGGGGGGGNFPPRGIKINPAPFFQTLFTDSGFPLGNHDAQHMGGQHMGGQHIGGQHMGGQHMGSLEKPPPIIKTIVVTLEQVFEGIQHPVEIERWIVQQDGKVFEKETIYVRIPKGIDDNEIICLNEKGNILRENCKGDVKLIVNVQNNTSFVRQGLDLLLMKSLTLKESLCGFQFDFKHLNGRIFAINHQGKIVMSGHKKTIPKLGLQRENDVGNLIIEFHVVFPEHLPPEKIALLRDIL